LEKLSFFAKGNVFSKSSHSLRQVFMSPTKDFFDKIHYVKTALKFYADTINSQKTLKKYIKNGKAIKLPMSPGILL
jgi:hypothetical protein